MNTGIGLHRVHGKRRQLATLLLLLIGLLMITARARAAWSDTQIVYTEGPGFTSLKIVNSDGSDDRYFLQDGVQIGGDSTADWSPDGSKVAFTSGFAADGELFSDAEIVVADAGGFDLDFLTANSFDDFHPAWSPDGTRIAFVSDRDGSFASTDIYVMDADGGNQTRLTFTGVENEYPDWSADGSMIAFECDWQICVMNSDGSDLTAITPADENSFTPAWSPVENRLAYVQESLTVGLDIVVVDPDGGNPVNLSNTPDVGEGDPAWSGDGEKIAFRSYQDSDTIIAHMNADGSDVTVVVASSADLRDPAWQPVAFEPPPPSDTLYVSPRTPGNVAGIAVRPQDILAHDLTNDTWSMYFDGSDVGVDRPLAAFTHLGDDSLLLVFSGTENLPGLNGITSSDIVRFVPSSLGDTTAGTFEWYLDGSDVGLSATEKIDALAWLGATYLAVSFTGNADFPQGGGVQLKARDEDLVFFEITTRGANSAGIWYYLQLEGSTVPGLAVEDVAGAHYEELEFAYYLSVLNGFNVAGANGNGKDIFRLTNLANPVATRFWRGPEHGFNLNISAFELDFH